MKLPTTQTGQAPFVMRCTLVSRCSRVKGKISFVSLNALLLSESCFPPNLRASLALSLDVGLRIDGTAEIGLGVSHALCLVKGVGKALKAQIGLRRLETNISHFCLRRISRIDIHRPSTRCGANDRSVDGGCGCIAQLVEQLTLNQPVLGSNPRAPTISFHLI